MATQDTSEEDVTTTEDEEVETSQEEDETTSEDETTETEETEDKNEDEDSEEDDDESETEDEDEPEFKKRFTQFKGDTYEEYVPELEKAHANLLGELTRIKTSDKEKQGKIDAVIAAAGKDPEFAKKLDDLLGENAEQVTVDPALLKARQDMEDSMEKEYKDFLDIHPELESDPKLQEEVFGLVTEFGSMSRKKGRIMPMKEALNKAWKYLGLDDAQEEIASKAKEVASKSKGKAVKKTSKKSDGYTDAQLKMAKKWGVSLD